MGLSAPESESAGEDRARFKVLVVDDERLLADTTSSILRTAGFHSRTAYDGWEALEIARTFHPDCVLTDVMMPMMNGLELAIAITKMFPGTKVVLFSGQAGIANIVEASRAQGYEFPLLAKPVHPLTLIEALKDCRAGD
jgi:CheY-like chemotaxis protein